MVFRICPTSTTSGCREIYKRGNNHMTTATHEIDYKIIGDDMQAVVVTLDP
jgi:hypothetical protein